MSCKAQHLSCCHVLCRTSPCCEPFALPKASPPSPCSSAASASRLNASVARCSSCTACLQTPACKCTAAENIWAPVSSLQQADGSSAGHLGTACQRTAAENTATNQAALSKHPAGLPLLGAESAGAQLLGTLKVQISSAQQYHCRIPHLSRQCEQQQVRQPVLSLHWQ